MMKTTTGFKVFLLAVTGIIVLSLTSFRTAAPPANDEYIIIG